MRAAIARSIALLLLGASCEVSNAGSINLESPIASAEATFFEAGGKSTTQSLSPQQIQQLSAWLAWYGHGWFGEKSSAADGPVELQVNLKRDDGTTAVLSVVPDDSTRKHHLFFADKELSWSYHSFFGQVKRPGASQPLPDYALDSLKKILAGK
jgi:hypothetical protein